jgi:hypothetical protein
MTKTLYLPKWLTYVPPGRLEFTDASGALHWVEMDTLALLETHLSTCIRSAASALMVANYGDRWRNVPGDLYLAVLTQGEAPKDALALDGAYVELLHSQRFPIVIPEELP